MATVDQELYRTTLTSGLGLHIVRKESWVPDELAYRKTLWTPKTNLGRIVKECLRFLPAEQAGALIEAITSCVIMESQLEWVVKRALGSPHWKTPNGIEDYGVVSRKVVTTEGVAALCVAWGSALFDMIYMGLSTVNTAAANTDTAANRFDAGSEIAANMYNGGVRPTCTHPQSANVIPMVGVHIQTTGPETIESHGILNSATRAAGLLWDRHVAGTTTLAVGETLTATYTLTASSE